MEKALCGQKDFSILENLPVPVIILNKDYTIQYINNYAGKKFRLSHQYYNRRVDNVFPWLAEALFSLTPGSDSECKFDQELITDEGVRFFEIKLKQLYGERRNYLGIMVVLTEMERVPTVYKQFEEIINFFPDPSFVINVNKEVIVWNRAMEEMTGVSKGDIIGKGNGAYSIPFYGRVTAMLIDLLDLSDPVIDVICKRNAYMPYRGNIEKKGKTLYKEAFVPNVYNGKGAFVRASASRLYDSNGNVVGAIESIRDITDRKSIVEELRYMSMHDSLTGLYNRTYFEKEMYLLGEDRAAIIVCDLDGLKLVNDSMGHAKGDELLLVTAGVLQKSIPKNTVIARIGGDEFAILLPRTTLEIVKDIVQQIKKRTADYNITNPELPLHLSVGFAFSAEKIPVCDLFKQADDKMYREKLLRAQSSRSAIVQTLTKALEARDFITEGHGERLESLVANFALAMDLCDYRITELRLLAQFHDIGKVGIPDNILFKRGNLTSEEFTIMHRHCEIGFRIAQSAPDLIPIADWILKHHEWWNGEGYPLKLKEKEIPLACRILAIADAYDAMTNDRPYRKAMSHQEAIAELKRYAGVQFDPYLVDKFMEIIENDLELINPA